MADHFQIDKDISKSKTLPAAFYRDPQTFEQIREKIFYRSWQWIGGKELLDGTKSVSPFVLLDGFLSEPMLLSRDGSGQHHCLSNVCTHRGNLVAMNPSATKKLICGYHGRRFALDGKFEFMPEFEETVNFPSECDHLHSFPLKEWGSWFFAGLDPAFKIDEVLGHMNERVGFLPLHDFKFRADRTKDYMVNAHWALYCDNYLEGFHIPFVHKDLNAVLEYSNYETLIFEHANVQIGYGRDGEEVFDLPKDHVDYGKKVAAYYFWVFPNMMFNFYPWGLSVNVVEPLAMNKTRVRFLSYVLDESKLDQGAGSGLDKVELEDEEVVEGVQTGIRSRYYKAGRFSSTREKGVHHFHLLLARYLAD